MLTQVRKTLRGAVAWFVIVLLILGFMFFGVPEVRQFTSNAAITVGDQSFSQQYVQSEFNRAVQVQRAESGGDFTQDQAIASGLHNEIVAQISTTSAVDQFADKLGLSIPRELVRDFLQENENFQNPATGKFDRNVLVSLLQRNSMSVNEFERRVRQDLRRNQLISALAARSPAPDPFIEAMLLRDTEQRRIRYLIVTDEMAGRAQEPTPDALQAYYEENPSTFTAPEYRTFDLLVLTSEDFREGAEAPEEELRRIYELNKERVYDKPERRTLYQITFETEAEAETAVAALRQGKPFENIASEHGRSLDAVTFTEATKADILNPAVADAAFAQGVEEGAILDPVQGILGWTVVQVAGVIPAEESTFEEKRAEIEEQYLEQDVRRALLDAIDEIEEARDTGAGLAAAAEAAGFAVETVGPVDRYSFAPGGAIVDKVPGEALSEAFLLEEGEESEARELAVRNGYFFVSVRDVIAPKLKPFEDVRDEVVERWRKEERKERVSAAVRDIREKVEAGESLETVAGQYDRAPTERVIDRSFTDEAISQAFSTELFSATPGELVSGPAGLGESQIVAEILDVGYARGRVPPEQVSMFEQYMGFQLDQELVEAFLSAVRDDARPKVNQAQLDAIFGEEQ